MDQISEKLRVHRARLEAVHMRDMFQSDPDRFNKWSLCLHDLVFDFSKNRLDEEAFTDLVELALARNIEERRDAMFAGERINLSEGRSVLHVALRKPEGSSLLLDGHDVMPGVLEVRYAMEGFSHLVRAGKYRPSGKQITDVVNIGIGGSDLGPRMVTEALRPFGDGPAIHFVANVDGADLADTIEFLDPETTLFIVASKSFTTQETMVNAHTAKKWMEDKLGETAAAHFCAISTNLKATSEFGIPEERTFGFWDWVGGRYSVWSAIGLPVMMAIGSDRFDEFLAGAHEVDEHFMATPLRENIPVIMGLLSIWYRDVWEHASHALLPYDNRLSHFPRWLQQLEMESNGKSVDIEGERLDTPTSPVIFGDAGTNAQHAFMQMLHQGSDVIPCDFLVAAKGHERDMDEHHRLLVANCLAQSEALMTGRTMDEASANRARVFAGNRPSNTFMYRQLNPHTLGMLMALYEHKTFVEGVLWGINSFDQWGVELGKVLAGQIEPLLNEDAATQEGNPSTIGLASVFHRFR